METDCIVRVNLVRIAGRPTATGQLVNYLCKQFADEYVSSVPTVRMHLESGSDEFGNFFVNFWQSHGWRITWYKVPLIGAYVDKNGSEELLGSLSFGFVIDDACEEFIAWKLANT